MGSSLNWIYAQAWWWTVIQVQLNTQNVNFRLPEKEPGAYQVEVGVLGQIYDELSLKDWRFWVIVGGNWTETGGLTMNRSPKLRHSKKSQRNCVPM